MKLSIGTSDFKKLREEGYYYVDKTLFIEELRKVFAEVVLIPRPRRFGKTLNISMLKYFYEISEENNAHLFENTAIWQKEEYQKMQGTYPVIFLTFKSCKQGTWENAYNKLTELIAQEFERHLNALTPSLSALELEKYLSIARGDATTSRYTNSLYFLSMLLKRHYKKRVIVLIDEYDAPIHAAYTNGYYKDMISFMRDLLCDALKDNSYLEQGVLTGILRTGKEGIFSGLNNLIVKTLLNNTFSDKFGFTQQEVDQLLIDSKLTHQSQAIQEWYNGYTFGTTSGIYNPWSVIHCVENNGVQQKYWVNTSDNALVKKLIAQASVAVKSKLELLISGKQIEEKIEESITLPDLDSQSELLWTLLLFTGYLSYEEYTIKKGDIYASLKIPNQEITYLYDDLIRTLFTESVEGNQVDTLLKALTTGDTEEFARLLQTFIYNSMSSFDLSSTEPEKSYHLFVLGLFVTLSDHYEVKSNRESGSGRYDLTIIPRTNDKPAVIMEFKVVRKGQTLETISQKALDQITEKKYTQDLIDRSIKTIIAYGIAFEGKTILVKSIELNQNVV